jgi:hypothetical protein
MYSQHLSLQASDKELWLKFRLAQEALGQGDLIGGNLETE